MATRGQFHRHIGLLWALLVALVGLPIEAQPRPTTSQNQVFLPILLGPALPPNPFGFDVRTYSRDEVVSYASAANPRWVRAGDVSWAAVEPVRGGGYRWEALAELEANIRRLRAAGVEPTLVVQQSPDWAQRVPGRLCSAMQPEYVGDFARFMGALVARYAEGPLAVNYWEIWNEPDFAPQQVKDSDGMGCWADAALPYHGGAYYGEVLKQVYPAVKAANPRAVVLAGALAYFWPDDTVSQAFLRGILASGAGNAFDMLSFHAYGEWGAGDLLINKTARIRQILSEFNLADKPLFATEIAATCGSNSEASCTPNFEQWKQHQANYAARIYAEAIALDLKGALWYTLALIKPGFQFSQLIDDEDGTLVPRPAYYAFRNSAELLQGARYVGPPVREPPPDQIDKVQVLTFRKANSTIGNGPSTLYVLWVPKLDMPNSAYRLTVAPGATAICAQSIQAEQLYRFYCSDTNGYWVIWLAINSFPKYVEVLDQ